MFLTREKQVGGVKFNTASIVKRKDSLKFNNYEIRSPVTLVCLKLSQCLGKVHVCTNDWCDSCSKWKLIAFRQSTCRNSVSRSQPCTALLDKHI